MEYKIFEGDFRPDFSWSYVLIKEIPSLDIMRCLMREGGFHRWQYRWLKAITISVLGTSRCDAYTVNKEVQTIIIIFDGVLLYNLLHNFSASWSHNQAMINTQRKIITYIALKSCLFFFFFFFAVQILTFTAPWMFWEPKHAAINYTARYNQTIGCFTT